MDKRALYQTSDSTPQPVLCTNFRGLQSIGKSSVTGQKTHTAQICTAWRPFLPHHTLGMSKRGFGNSVHWLDVVEVQDLTCMCQSVQNLLLRVKPRRSPGDPDLRVHLGRKSLPTAFCPIISMRVCLKQRDWVTAQNESEGTWTSH